MTTALRSEARAKHSELGLALGKIRHQRRARGTWIFAALFTPNFATIDNLQNVLMSASFVGVAAVGMTIAIISGTFDLSVGSNLALCATAAVWTGAHFGVIPAIVVGIVVGMMVGTINGFLVAGFASRPLSPRWA